MRGGQIGHLGRETALRGRGQRGRGADSRFCEADAICGGGLRLAGRGVGVRGERGLVGLCGDMAHGRKRHELQELGPRGAEGGEGGEGDGR